MYWRLLLRAFSHDVKLLQRWAAYNYGYIDDNAMILQLRRRQLRWYSTTTPKLFLRQRWTPSLTPNPQIFETSTQILRRDSKFFNPLLDFHSIQNKTAAKTLTKTVVETVTKTVAKTLENNTIWGPWSSTLPYIPRIFEGQYSPDDLERLNLPRACLYWW